MKKDRRHHSPLNSISSDQEVLSEKTFEVDHLDPLAQGVSKINDSIYFIAKSLPEETVKAKIYRKKKKIFFAETTEVIKASKKRIAMECIHFNECPSCHLLHVSYEDEINHKEQTLKRQLLQLSILDIKVIKATSRFNYRNRIQLHYSVYDNLLGYSKPYFNTITESPSCKVPLLLIQEKLKELYENSFWKQVVIGHPKKGHIELYYNHSNKMVDIHVNKQYSHGGFSQINDEMNNKLLEILKSNIFLKKSDYIIDLFGGSGNLSSQFEAKSLVVDNTDKKLISLKSNQSYLQLNLYNDNNIEILISQINKFSKKIDLLILDPPRSGFKRLESIIEAVKPVQVVYISCFSSTLVRDISSLNNLNNYKIEQTFLIDFFPSTYHFETMMILTKI